MNVFDRHDFEALQGGYDCGIRMLARTLFLPTSEGQLMHGDTRNSKVVVCLILAMTIGAGILLWLEPKPDAGMLAAPMMAAGDSSLKDVVVAYVPPGEVVGQGANCVILPDGRGEFWRPAGACLRVAVVGSAKTDALPEAQQQALLSLLSGLTRPDGGEAVHIRLDPPTVTDESVELPPVRELRDLLVRKGMLG
ncbi:MAG: hypothetical protein PVJ57_13135 [Phycisphaerae bacterium]|jgi:hypothetical protein